MIEKELQNFNAIFETVISKIYENEGKLSEACRYALEGPGKRVRPLLILLTHKMFSEQWINAVPAAIAVEMIHTYSLVHDDMPLMDNDDYRRGRLTVHKIYGDANALLVGDALLSDAFFCLAGGLRNHLPEYDLPSETEIQMTRELSKAIGSSGMVYGQSLDMEFTGKSNYQFEDLVRIHSNKTGKLIAASCALGALAGRASLEQVEVLRRVGERFGLAYQIMDDLIDDNKNTGKSSGKDKTSGKLTYLSLMSREDAQKKVEQILEEISSDLRAFGEKAQPLTTLLSKLTHRTF